MEICKSTEKTDNKKETNQGNIQNEEQEQTKENNLSNIPKSHLGHIESEVSHLNPFTQFDSDTLKKLSKAMCKIVMGTEKERKIGKGFIVYFQIDMVWFKCLITNEHIINNECINNNEIISISYEENKIASIKLDKNKRYIKSFKDENLDITVIEILNDEDNISSEYFLESELDIPINNALINNEIYIPQYIEGQQFKIAEGIIKDIIKYEFNYSANIDKGSSGNPIFLKNSNKVIGIHKEGAPIINENYGDFIYPVINIITEDFRKRNSIGKYINGKYIYDDGKYYIGEFKNEIPNGKGIKYYKNGNILYDGNFINGKFEESGKYIWENGEYYIGQFKNGLRNGKGIEYYEDGSIEYDGDWINDKFEGNGKYIYESGEYYVGQFKNGLSNGKGIEYYENGDIKYEGDFVNDKYEGNGKYIWENGIYYIGQYKNGLSHGKGTMYSSNGDIKYKGDWVNGKQEGNGKFIWKNGNYYIGQWKNGLRNGEGTMYLPNGDIKKKGNWINDEFVGN